MYACKNLCTHLQMFTHLQICLLIYRSMYAFTDLIKHLQIYVRIYRSVYAFTDLCMHLHVTGTLIKHQHNTNTHTQCPLQHFRNTLLDLQLTV